MHIKYPIYKPYLTEDERNNILDCYDSSWISSKGKYIDLFEKDFSEYLGVKYSTSVSNGTVALHLALYSLGIGKHDEVIVPSLTYIASVNAISYVEQNRYLLIVKKTWNIAVNEIEKKDNKNTKAIMVVHLYGNPCKMEDIIKIAKKYNLYIIEDCAEALGSSFKNKLLGGLSDVSTFSFFGNKTITTGEGGMVSTNDKKLFEKLKNLKVRLYLKIETTIMMK